MATKVDNVWMNVMKHFGVTNAEQASFKKHLTKASPGLYRLSTRTPANAPDRYVHASLVNEFAKWDLLGKN